jgi:hypothetical protein
MIPVGSPVAAPDEPAARAAVADQLLRMRMRQAWFGQNGGDFLVLEGERVALLLADAQLVREEYAADVHYAPHRKDQPTRRRGLDPACGAPVLRYMRALGDAASRYPDVFDTNVRLQLALQIRQGAAAGASGQIKPT